jgi:acetyl esterase/lipase
MRHLIVVFILLLPLCTVPACSSEAQEESLTKVPETLVEARQDFNTKIVRQEEGSVLPEVPVESDFELVRYKSAVGPLAAYVTKDPGDGKRHPAIVWITGGDCNSIGDVWTQQPRDNYQSVSGFRDAGIVTMFPSLRGGNENPGKREGFYGEVDDILAATEHLAALSYVDPKQIYLGGHSTGGTLVMLVGATTDRFRGIISLGPVAAAEQYGGQFVYCDPNDESEMRLRSPMHWLHCVESPMYVLEGASGNWDGAIKLMADANGNPKIEFFRIPGHDHFSVIAPLVEIIADEIVAGQIKLNRQSLLNLR